MNFKQLERKLEVYEEWDLLLRQYFEDELNLRPGYGLADLINSQRRLRDENAKTQDEKLAAIKEAQEKADRKSTRLNSSH